MRKMRPSVGTLALTLLLAGTAPAQTVTVQTGTGGAAATVDERATRAALDVLRAGGNAVDATVAAAAVLNVTEPFSAGIGGGGFMLIHDARRGIVTSIDAREKAPASATPTMFLLPNGQPIPFAPDRITSGLAVGVPGTLAGWDLALKRYGTKPLAELLAPAITVAENGFPVDATFRDQVEANRARFALFPDTARLFLDANGASPAVGSVHRNPDLARTFRLVAQQGVNVFYTGEIGADLVRAVQAPPAVGPTPFPVRGANMTARDLADYSAIERLPTFTRYRDLAVYGMGTPSSGGLTIGLALNILSGYDLKALPREQATHLYLEASRLAYADRGAFLGDGDFARLPITGLFDPAFAASRRALIKDTATENPPPGDVTRFGAPAAPTSEAEDTTGRETTHLTVSDAQGNVVAYTFTIESIGGSGFVVPGRGFLLNNELTDFDAAPGGPNAPAPFKRPRSSMSPTIVFQNGKPYLALGSPGGSTIITTVLQTLVNVIDFGQNLPDALNASRLSQRNASTTSVEPGADPALLAALTARGHRFGAPAEIGAATGIAFNADGSVTAVAEARRRGSGAAGVISPR